MTRHFFSVRLDYTQLHIVISSIRIRIQRAISAYAQHIQKSCAQLETMSPIWHWRQIGKYFTINRGNWWKTCDWYLTKEQSRNFINTTTMPASNKNENDRAHHNEDILRMSFRIPIYLRVLHSNSLCGHRTERCHINGVYKWNRKWYSNRVYRLSLMANMDYYDFDNVIDF